MPVRFQCFDDPPTILKQPLCVSNLSKDATGTLKPIGVRPQRCKLPPCETLKTVHALVLRVGRHSPCDAEANYQFGGRLTVERLVSAFDRDGTQRGFHSGNFTWAASPALKVAGRMSGVTNVGTHRNPAFTDCQTCDARGVMEGKLCGRVVSARDPTLRGAQVIAAYRIRVEPTKEGGRGAVRAVIEGVVIRFCRG